MVLRPDVSAAAIDSLPREGRPLIYLTPRGKPLTQAMVREWSAGPGVIVFCGRFEGLDQRVIEARGMDEVSVGDAVLAGGEAPAMVLIEACVRLIPGVLGKIESTEDESFEGDLLEYPHYTRPREWEEREIPDVLLSGDHGRIARWRKEQAEDITRLRRPDLWKRYQRRQGEEP
jgi:tRNA (guanine37-N1)-methyltransferase